MSGSRTKNSKRNIISGMIRQVIHLLLNFALRTAIIYVLGAEYQGLNGLFTSILHVLNLTDLGFSTAVTYILYRPIAEHDENQICAIINYLKRAYFIIGVIILTAGLSITPFLKLLVKGEVPTDINIYLLFVFYLVNTAASYLLFAYKSTLFSAMQRNDVTSNVYTITTTTTNLLQLLSLFIFKNYYAYIIFLPIGTIVNSIVIEYQSRKYFPEIIPYGKIPLETRNELTKQVKAIFIGKIGDVARNSFDNIVISMLLGLVMITVYGNYYYIYTAIYGIMNIIIHGIMASVGNSIATESIEKNYNDMQKINFIFMWIVGCCTTCMLCLYQPFMTVWMNGRSEMMLSDYNMGLFCIYFYAINMTYVRSMYLDGYGLFYECRYWFIIEALSNLILNFALGYLWGVTGIILATILTIFFFNFICRTNILFKHYFKSSPRQFYMQHAKYCCVTIVVAISNYLLCNCIKVYGIVGILIRLIICVTLSNVMMTAIYCRDNQFKKALIFAKAIIKRTS